MMKFYPRQCLTGAEEAINEGEEANAKPGRALGLYSVTRRLGWPRLQGTEA